MRRGAQKEENHTLVENEYSNSNSFKEIEMTKFDPASKTPITNKQILSKEAQAAYMPSSSFAANPNRNKANSRGSGVYHASDGTDYIVEGNGDPSSPNIKEVVPFG